MFVSLKVPSGTQTRKESINFIKSTQYKFPFFFHPHIFKISPFFPFQQFAHSPFPPFFDRGKKFIFSFYLREIRQVIERESLRLLSPFSSCDEFEQCLFSFRKGGGKRRLKVKGKLLLNWQRGRNFSHFLNEQTLRRCFRSRGWTNGEG